MTNQTATAASTAALFTSVNHCRAERLWLNIFCASAWVLCSLTFSLKLACCDEPVSTKDGELTIHALKQLAHEKQIGIACWIEDDRLVIAKEFLGPDVFVSVYLDPLLQIKFCSSPQLADETKRIGALIELSTLANRLAVNSKQNDRFEAAYHLYRFGLVAAIKSGDETGADVIVRNILELKREIEFRRLGRFVSLNRKSLRDDHIIVSAKDVANHSVKRERFVARNGDLIVSRNPKAQNPATDLASKAYAKLLKQIADDGQILKSRANAMATRKSSHVGISARAKFLDAEFMRALLWGSLETKYHSYLAIHKLALRQNRHELALGADLDFICSNQVLLSNSFLASVGNDGTDLDPANESIKFDDAWNAYLSDRKQITDLRLHSELLRSYVNLFRVVEHLQLSTLSSSNPAFHARVAGLVAEYLQPLGRDLAFLLYRENRHEESFEYAERCRARSFLGWAAFSHESDRLMFNEMQDGYAVGPRPATVREFAELASNLDTPIIAYLRVQLGYCVWIMTTEGQLVSTHIEDPHELIAGVSSAIQQFPGRRTVPSRQVVRKNSASTTAKDHIGKMLGRLYVAMLPEPIRDALDHEPARLIIVTDSELELVPFAALRTERHRYLVETHAMTFVPAVTSLYLLETFVETHSTNAGPHLQSVVFGDIDFSKPISVKTPSGTKDVAFSSLPGAAREVGIVAKLLSARQVRGKSATKKAFFDIEPMTPVVHFATHGVSDFKSGYNSYLVCADGALTAGELYPQLGQGYNRARLVMLSACQTGDSKLGMESSWGLVNAIVINGANSVGSSLWSVDDDATCRLMKVFYESLMSQDSLGRSMQKAQLNLISNERMCDPFFWAAFKISGANANPLFHSLP